MVVEKNFANQIRSKVLTYTNDLLSPGTQYRFQVQTLNPAGASEKSEIVSILCVAEPSKVRDLKVGYQDKSGMALSWRPPDDDGGDPIMQYRVYYKDLNST